MELTYYITVAEATETTTNFLTKGNRSFDLDVVASFYTSTTVESTEEADRIIALFPKSVGLRSSILNCGDGSKKGMIRMDASLLGGKVNGGVNETGMKRIATFVKKAAALGFTLVNKDYYLNTHPEGLKALGL